MAKRMQSPGSILNHQTILCDNRGEDERVARVTVRKTKQR